MAHTMVYSIAGAGYSSRSELARYKSAGFIDIHIVIPGGFSVYGGYAGNPTSQQFITDCNALKISPVLNNGNDAHAGWDSSGEQYYKTAAALGYHAAGGESEQNAEDHAIMRNLPFMNYGGEGLNPLSNIFANILPEGASGHGIANYLETYKSDAMTVYSSEIVESCKQAWAHQGSAHMEVGIMIGNWIVRDNPNNNATTYYNLILAIEKATGKPCSGVCLWGGHEQSMESVYSGNEGIISTLQKTWPASGITLKERWTGVAPQPGPEPPAPTPTGTSFDELTDFDVYQYLTKAHNGEPTPGTHEIVITPHGATTISATVSAQVREFQPGNE